MILFFQRLDSYGPSSKEEIVWASIEGVDGDILLELGATCNWLGFQNSEKVCLFEDGYRILSLISGNLKREAFRKMICDYIQSVFPSWAARIPYGREETSIILSKDERACLYEAGLLSKTPDLGVIAWWDNLAQYIRKKTEEQKNQTGRTGEQVTMLYELKRTHQKPKWMSIESNLCGYDIKSQIDELDLTPLMIEVKASVSPIENAVFHISEKEWETATVIDEYKFYLWSFAAGKRYLAILNKLDVSPYIPENRMTGRWETVRIPFLEFQSKFVEVE